MAAVLELLRLGGDHHLDHGEEAVEGVGDSSGPHASERVDQQPVAGEDRGGVAVHHAGGVGAASTVAEVDDVVVQQRRAVHQLHRHRELEGGRREARAEAGGEGDTQRAEALASAGEEVARGVPNSVLGGRNHGEGRFDLREIRADEALKAGELIAEASESTGAADGLEALEHRRVEGGWAGGHHSLNLGLFIER